MGSEETLPQSELGESSVSPPFPKGGWWKLLYGLCFSVLPALLFWGTKFLLPFWQSGRLSDYIALSLLSKASWVFYPLIIYSSGCYLTLLIAPIRYAEKRVVRLGIYTGTLLAFQYSILTLLFNPTAAVLMWGAPFVWVFLYRLSIKKWKTEAVYKAFFVITITLLFFAGSASFILVAFSAPFWCFLLAFRASVWLFKNYETKLTLQHGFGFITWIVVYIAAWRYDILKMFELYATLPTKPPPDCYIATAAARGHPQFVHSKTVQCADGKSMQVNGQLQVLKCLELALMAINPRLHKFLRRIYDVLGRSLACGIYNPFVADVAYLLLKPFEWLAELSLKTIISDIDSISKEIYIH